MKTTLVILILAFLGLSIAGCSNSTSIPQSEQSWPPGVGTNYVVSETLNNNPELTDTMRVVVDAINLHYQGRDSVSRLIRSYVGFNRPAEGSLFDTFYIHYLSSGDIETESSNQAIKSFNYYPFATQHSLVKLEDSVLGGKLYRDTVVYSGAGLHTMTVSGNTVPVQSLNISHSGFIDGVYNAERESISYLPSLGYFGSESAIPLMSDSATSTQELIAFNLE